MKKVTKRAPVVIDTKAGNLSYNRTDMQLSQTLHMAIELHPNLNYLLILDHYIVEQEMGKFFATTISER